MPKTQENCLELGERRERKEGEEGEDSLLYVLGHHDLGLESLVQGDKQIAGKDSRSPVSTSLYLEMTSSTGMEEGGSTSPQTVS